MSSLSQSEINPYAPPVADLDGSPLDLDADQLLGATRGQRFVAAFLDGLLYLPLIGLGLFATMGKIADKQTATLVLQAFTVPLSVLQWVLTARTGQSLGKRWTKIKIVKVDGTPINFVSGVLLRNWILYMGPLLLSIFVEGTQTVTSVVSLFDILFIFGAAHRCLHDYIAGTKVVALPGANL